MLHIISGPCSDRKAVCLGPRPILDQRNLSDGITDSGLPVHVEQATSCFIALPERGSSGKPRLAQGERIAPSVPFTLRQLKRKGATRLALT